MSDVFKGMLTLTAFVVAIVVGSAAFAECAGHKKVTASAPSSTLTASGSLSQTKKPGTGG